MSLGTESAIKIATLELFNNREVESEKDFYAEKMSAIIKSGNLAVIKYILETKDIGFNKTVNNDPRIQQAFGDVVKYLNDKFNNDEYLTLEEQEVKALLENNCVNKDGVSIAAKTAVAASGETPAQAEVFAKTMVTDNEGNSYYKATLTEENAPLQNVEFRAKDDKILDAFLADLKVADSEEKKTALFKKYAEMENADPELLKSIVAQAPALNASAEDVIALVNKSNLDVIYAMNTSHFEDTPEADGQAEVKDKTNVQNAIKARIEAIMADPTLAKLPENAKYLDKIKGVDISGQQTEFTKTPDLTGYTSTTEDVPTGQKDESGNDIKVTVTKYTKEGQPDVYAVEARSDNSGTDVRFYADSRDAALAKKAEFEKAELKREPSNETAEAAVARKRENLNILMQRFESNPTKKVFLDIVVNLKSSFWIDKNDPDAKALVQKLLLTRDADIVSALVKDEDGDVDNTLFENDPVAHKTLAAMFKEIRDLENQGVKLTPEQIALKDELDDLDSGKVRDFGTTLPDGNRLRFDGDGNLAVYDGEFGYIGNNSATARFMDINDPIIAKDKYQLASYISLGLYRSLSKDEMIKLINLDTVDAELLSYVDFGKLDSNMSAADKKAVQDAYVEKAKALFQYDTPAEGAKLDPANARYLKTILDKIDDINEAGEDGNDPDEAVIDEILGRFFVTTGEGGNAVTTIKDFRRFTYEEMEGLADAVANYGSKEQDDALANMITVEDMEAGQFVRAIEIQCSEGDNIDNSIREQYARFIDSMTTKEEVLAFIDKMSYPSFHIPFDKILEKFPDDSNIQQKLAQKLGTGSNLSKENLNKLLSSSSIKASSYENNRNVYHDESKKHYIYYEETKSLDSLQDVAFVDSNGYCWDTKQTKVLGKIVDGKYEPIVLCNAAKTAGYRTTNTKGVFYDESAKKHYYFNDKNVAVEMKDVGFIDECGICYKYPNKKNKIGEFKNGKYTPTTS